MKKANINTILVEIEDWMWNHQADFPNIPMGIDKDGFRAGTKIFMTAMMETMWADFAKKEVPLKKMTATVKQAGADLRKLVKKYTKVDTKQMY